MRAPCMGLLGLIVILSSTPTMAGPPGAFGAPIVGQAKPKPPRQPWRKRAADRIRAASKRTANAFHRLHDKTPPIVRHGTAAILFAGITYVSAEGLSGQDLMSLKGMLSATGVTVGTGTTLRQTCSTLRCAFPGAMEGARKRVLRSPVGPLFKHERPFWQRLGGIFRRGPDNH